MDGVVSELSKVITQCGAVSTLLAFAIGWLAIQLAKNRAAWEADRAEWLKLREADRALAMKLLENKSALEVKLTEAIAKAETMAIAIRMRGDSD